MMARRMLMMVALLAGVAGVQGAALAQSTLDGRVDRLEREMRAVQRKVFPGGNGQYFPPDNAPVEAPIQPPGQPATSAIGDLTARVSSIESQLSTLTAQSEQDHHRLQLVEDAFAAYRRATDARIAALEQAAPGAAAGASAPAKPAALDPVKPAPAKPAAAPAPKTAAPAPAPAADPKRAALLASVEKPATGDPADDLYVYGYRLWQAKLYTEAEAPLKQVVAKYPTHRRASWAQNLLGRTYLDEGRPSLASHAFYDNYKNFHEGERAPDSLYYLAVSLKQLGKPSADICKVYDELLDVYGSRISAQMKADVARGRAAEKCKTN